MQQQKNDKTTCLLLALTTIFWGSLYTASKVLLDVIQPFTLLCLRYQDRSAVRHQAGGRIAGIAH